VLKKEIRQARIKTLLKVLPYLSGGARLSTVYADISPKFVIFCVTDSGNHLFQEIASIYQHLNIKALMESVNDFNANIKSDIYVALKNGFLDSMRNEMLQDLHEFNKKDSIVKFIFNDDLGGVNDITKRFADEVVPKLFEIESI
jgi:CRISPR-associated protein Cst2